MTNGRAGIGKNNQFCLGESEKALKNRKYLVKGLEGKLTFGDKSVEERTGQVIPHL